MKIKRLLIALLIAVLLFSVACGNRSVSSKKSKNKKHTEVSVSVFEEEESGVLIDTCPATASDVKENEETDNKEAKSEEKITEEAKSDETKPEETPSEVPSPAKTASEEETSAEAHPTAISKSETPGGWAEGTWYVDGDRSIQLSFGTKTCSDGVVTCQYELKYYWSDCVTLIGSKKGDMEITDEYIEFLISPNKKVNLKYTYDSVNDIVYWDVDKAAADAGLGFWLSMGTHRLSR